jgi:hypothetical protein
MKYAMIIITKVRTVNKRGANFGQVPQTLCAIHQPTILRNDMNLFATNFAYFTGGLVVGVTICLIIVLVGMWNMADNDLKFLIDELLHELKEGKNKV